MTNKLVHNIKRILANYGDRNQKKKALEELGELSLAIMDEMYCEGSREHIKEEIADVYVMLEQLKMIYHITDMEVLEVMEYKVNRQLGRIRNE